MFRLFFSTFREALEFVVFNVSGRRYEVTPGVILLGYLTHYSQIVCSPM